MTYIFNLKMSTLIDKYNITITKLEKVMENADKSKERFYDIIRIGLEVIKLYLQQQEAKRRRHRRRRRARIHKVMKARRFNAILSKYTTYSKNALGSSPEP